MQENIYALVQIFHAIPSLFFSAPAELRTSVQPTSTDILCSNESLNYLLRQCSIHPRRPTSSGSLEKQFGKAKSSMPLRYSPAPPIYLITSLWDRVNKLKPYIKLSASNFDCFSITCFTMTSKCHTSDQREHGNLNGYVVMKIDIKTCRLISGIVYALASLLPQTWLSPSGKPVGRTQREVESDRQTKLEYSSYQ